MANKKAAIQRIVATHFETIEDVSTRDAVRAILLQEPEYLEDNLNPQKLAIELRKWAGFQKVRDTRTGSELKMLADAIDEL